MRDIWVLLQQFGVDIVVSGHDHVYERFAPQDGDGVLDTAHGIREFVAGTGGASLYDFPRRETNSEMQLRSHGVLKLTLRGSTYAWEFIPAARNPELRDSGADVCR